MLIFTTITILLVYVALVMIAYRKNNPAWKIGCVGVVLAILVGREMFIDLFAESYTLSLFQEGMLSKGFNEGVLDALIIVQRSGIFVFSLYLIILALFVKGFRRPEPKLKNDNQLK